MDFDVAEQGHQHAQHGQRHRQDARVDGARQVGSLAFQQEVAEREEGHHRQEGDGVHPRQRPQLAVGDEQHRQAQQKERDENDVVAAPRVHLQEELRQDAVEGHAVHQAAHAHEAREHGPAEHGDGIDGDERAQPGAAGHHAHVGEQRFGMLAHGGQRQHRNGQKGNERVEHRDHHPHVAQSFLKHAPRLLLHEVGRAFEARDAQHGRAEPEEQRRGEAATGNGRAEVFHQHAQAIVEQKPARGQHQRGERNQVGDEDGNGHLSRLRNAHDGEHQEQAQQADGGQDDGQAVHQRVQVVHGLGGRNHGRGHVGEDGEAGRDGSVALARGIQQHVVGAAVQGQGAHHFAVYFAEQKQHRAHHQQRHPGVLPGVGDGQRRDVQAGGGNIVAADGGSF